MVPRQVSRRRGERRLPRSFYRRDPRDVAPELLGKLLVAGDRAGRIVEVEAYCGAEDPGSHAFRGPTPRNASMFGPPGLLYVYFTYGMHWCANVVCGDEGVGVAVLLRALAPRRGLAAMRLDRPAARRDVDLCSGPARLCQAMRIDGGLDGTDLVVAQHGITVVDDGTPPPARPGRGLRVGLSRGEDLPYRWWVEGDPNVSRPPVVARERAG
ncbi:MAG: DNA-3-methyladenine glycosylase [Actinobacteria bacterium]|nr:DNA-3-methyladenine glycosylase [Actinomycetota bacterium]